MSRKARGWIAAFVFAVVVSLTFIGDRTRSAWGNIHRWVSMSLDSGEGEAVVQSAQIKVVARGGVVDPEAAEHIVELTYLYSVNFRPHARVEVSPVFESRGDAEAVSAGLMPGAKIKVLISIRDPKVAVYFVEGLGRTGISSVLVLGGIFVVTGVMLGVWVMRRGDEADVVTGAGGGGEPSSGTAGG
ncbi:MAG: hypothetical protein IT435_18445 [Phycisphaerales bacterium]|nr:hypothetical protein [Phycisphaerales bacterium]